MKTNTEVYYIIMNMNVKSMEVEITDEKIKIGLLGLGNIGTGTYKTLDMKQKRSGICSRNQRRDRQNTGKRQG